MTGRAYRFEARALDQPGLVHEVAEVFREHGVDVETLERDLERACGPLGFDWTLAAVEQAS